MQGRIRPTEGIVIKIIINPPKCKHPRRIQHEHGIIHTLPLEIRLSLQLPAG